MKALILSITTGEGHNSSARALVEAVRARGLDCVLHDAYYCASRPVYHVVNRVYRLCGNSWRHAYGSTYHRCEKKIGARSGARMGAMINRMLSPRVGRLIEREAPDVILYTHVFAGQILESLRKRGRLSVPTIGIVTDYTIHPRWERLAKLGHLVLANEDFVPMALERGFPENSIHPFGIPLRSCFKTTLPREEAKRALGISPGENVVLVMCGNTGYGSPARLITELDLSSHHFRFLAVCGRSKKHYKHIARLSLSHPINIYDYTDRIDLFMSAADCLVSKPGGLSSSEALTRALPLFIYNPIPGHEERNAEFLSAKGAAVMIDKLPSPSAGLDRFFSDEEWRSSLSDGARALARPNAADDIATLAATVTTKKN